MPSEEEKWKTQNFWRPAFSTSCEELFLVSVWTFQNRKQLQSSSNVLGSYRLKLKTVYNDGSWRFVPTLVANCVFNGFLSYTAIVLNIIIIQALRKTSSLPKTLKTLLLSVSISNLGVGLLVEPLYVAHMCLTMEITKTLKTLLIGLFLKHMPSLAVYSFWSHFLVFSQ